METGENHVVGVYLKIGINHILSFFQAIRMQKKWAVESMCDNGAEVEELKANGRSPLLYSAINGFDEVCMYLCLRVKDVDVEDE